jgi:hypothetical protein
MRLSLPPIDNGLKAVEEELMEEERAEMMIACEQNLSKNRRVLSDRSK